MGRSAMTVKDSDLFAWTPDAYPTSPGSKAPRRETSVAAAVSIQPQAPVLRERCFSVIQEAPRTADEVADVLGIHFLTARPRLSELCQLGKIVDSGERRPSRGGGRPMIVWRERCHEDTLASLISSPDTS